MTIIVTIIVIITLTTILMDITNVCNVKNPCVPMRCAVKIIPNDNSIPMVVSDLSHGTPR